MQTSVGIAACLLVSIPALTNVVTFWRLGLWTLNIFLRVIWFIRTALPNIVAAVLVAVTRHAEDTLSFRLSVILLYYGISTNLTRDVRPLDLN